MKWLLLSVLVMAVSGSVCYAQTPSFASPVFYAVSQPPTTVLKGDFTGDAKLDLAVLSTSPAKVSIFRNTGAGAFALLSTFTPTSPSSNYPLTIAAGDFDGDGDLDIVGLTSTGLILVLTNTGTGTSFTSEYLYPLSGSNMSIAVGYFNGDNKADFAVSYPNGTSVTKLRVLLSSNSSSSIQFYETQSYNVGDLPNDVATADFSGDGITDIATGNSSSSNISILRGDGTGYFFPPVNYPTGTTINKIAAADFNGDNRPDIALTRSGFSDGRVLLNNGSGGLGSAVAWPSGGNVSYHVIGADVNGDEKNDLVLKLSTSIAIYPGNGDGTFGSLFSLSAGATTSETLEKIVTGDFNNDGKTDIVGVLASGSTGRIAVLLNNGTFTPEPTVAASGISFTNVTATTARVNWTSGNGAGRIVVAKEGAAVSQPPVDLTAYTANASFTAAQDIGSGNRVVYAGTGNFVDVTGLTGGKIYHFAVYEYNGSGTSINYLTTNPPRGNVTMMAGVFVTDPANNTTANSITLTINGEAGASLYTVEIATNANFTGTTFIKSGGLLTTNFPEMVVNTTYYVRVKSNLSSAWGPTTSFVAGPPEAFAYITTPPNNSIATSNALTSNVVPGAASYTIEISTSPAFGTGSVTKTSSRTISFPELLFGTVYYVHVRTNLSATWGPTQNFTTGAVESFTFVTSPADGTTTSQYNVTANSVAGATSYTIEVSTSASFATGAGTARTSSSRIIAFPELGYSQTYYTRVKTNLSVNWGPTKRFNTGTVESFSYLVSPANGQINVPVDVELVPNVINGATMYELRVSEYSDFSVIFDQPQGSGTPYKPMLFGLTYGATYYVQVRTNLSAIWGQTRSFTTITDPGARVAQAEFADQVFPNDFTDQISFAVKDSRVQNASVAILDSRGMQVYQSPNHSTGDVNQIAGLEHLPRGIYYLRVMYGGEMKSFRIVKR